MEFEFDLSDDILQSDETITVKDEVKVEKKEVKKIEKISDLTIEQKIQINNVLWYSELTNESLKTYLMEEFGLKDIIAENLTYRHIQNYRKDPGFYTIFEKSSIESRNIKSVAMAERFEIRKKANSRKPIVIYR